MKEDEGGGRRKRWSESPQVLSSGAQMASLYCCLLTLPTHKIDQTQKADIPLEACSSLTSTVLMLDHSLCDHKRKKLRDWPPLLAQRRHCGGRTLGY